MGDTSRRMFGIGAAAVAGSAVVGGGRLGAQPASAVHRFAVGAAKVTVVSDGYMELPPAIMLPDRPRADIDALFKDAGQSYAGLVSQINVAIVDIDGERVLVDAGSGADFVPTMGKLAERLEAAGIGVDTITRVVFTHAHVDHLGGVIDPFGGGTIFEKASHTMSGAELDWWLQPDVDTRVSENFRGMALGTHRRLKIVADRIARVAPGAEIVPGVQLVDTAGHTPGHVSVLVRSATEQLLIGGDVLTQHVVSFAAPDWRWGPDMDPAKAAAARRRTLDMLATDRTRLLGYHLPWPGVGRVERQGTAWRFVA
jgi:glyoxylase-like metal-dependent hydrolase (beta-lactamase superfamily II)